MLLHRVEVVVPDNEILRVSPAKLNKHTYAYASAMFKILLASSDVRERCAPILDSINTVSERNKTLIVPASLTLADLYLVWGSPPAPYIEQIIYKDEDSFYFADEKWRVEREIFEKLYGVSCPRELLSLFHFNRVALDAFDVEHGIFESLNLKIRCGVETNLDPLRGAEEGAILRGKSRSDPLEYYPYAWYGADGVNSGIFIDYYRKGVLYAYIDTGSVMFSRNLWDPLLEKLNESLVFEWNCSNEFHDSHILGEDAYTRTDDCNIYNDNDSDEDDLERVKGFGTVGSYYQGTMDEELALQTFQRMIVSYLRHTPVKTYSINRDDCMALYIRDPLEEDLGPYTVHEGGRKVKREGMYLYEVWDIIRTLPLKYCRWQDVEKIDSIILPLDDIKILDNLSSHSEELVLAEKEANEGYPLLAYFIGFVFWDYCDVRSDVVALRLIKASLPQLGMDALLKTVEMHAVSRHKSNGSH